MQKRPSEAGPLSRTVTMQGWVRERRAAASDSERAAASRRLSGEERKTLSAPGRSSWRRTARQTMPWPPVPSGPRICQSRKAGGGSGSGGWSSDQRELREAETQRGHRPAKPCAGRGAPHCGQAAGGEGVPGEVMLKVLFAVRASVFHWGWVMVGRMRRD